MGEGTKNQRVKVVKVSVKNKEYERVCLFCGNDNPLGSKFCGYCGNPLREKKILKKIRINYLGGETIVLNNTRKYTFSDKDLTVYAKYDDGSERAIPFSLLRLEPNTIIGNAGNTLFYIKVIYTEGGITKYGEFSVYCIAPIADTPELKSTTQPTNGWQTGLATVNSQNDINHDWERPIITRRRPFCLRCDSERMVLEKKGFSYGKATVGVLLVGAAGALAGGIGANDYVYRCLDCGYITKASSFK